MTIRGFAILGAVLALAACGGRPDYYLLPAPQAAERVASPASSIAVSDISLPSYAEATEVAALDESGVVSLDRGALWADTPRRALTRHLVAALQTRLRAQIATEPWPELDRPALRIDVVADRLIARPDGAVEFTGQYIIVAPESGSITASERFAITVPPQGAGYPGLFAAHARAIEVLAGDLAAAIRGVPRPARAPLTGTVEPPPQRPDATAQSARRASSAAPIVPSSR